MNPKLTWFIWWGIIFLISMGGCLGADTPQICLYKGGSDPSAAAAMDGHFFVVGDDEHNILKIYSMDNPPNPVSSLDITGFLMADSEHPEADIEAAARLGERIYWITSHGRNKDGKIRPSRYRFFATETKKNETQTDPNSPPQLIAVGKPCSTLVTDMLMSAPLNQLNLKNVTRLGELLSNKEQERLAPKEEGLNIEGLAAGPDGQSLWIALRNPLYTDVSKKRNAIIIPLLNPQQVIEQGKPAQFGQPIFLDLGGRGIRSIDYLEKQEEFLITAGSVNTQVDFAVFIYHYRNQTISTLKVEYPGDFTPEGVFVLPGRNKVCFISDDGTIQKEVQFPADCMKGELLSNGYCPNKFLVDINQRTFRILLFSPESL